MHYTSRKHVCICSSFFIRPYVFSYCRYAFADCTPQGRNNRRLQARRQRLLARQAFQQGRVAISRWGKGEPVAPDDGEPSTHLPSPLPLRVRVRHPSCSSLTTMLSLSTATCCLRRESSTITHATKPHHFRANALVIALELMRDTHRTYVQTAGSCGKL